MTAHSDLHQYSKANNTEIQSPSQNRSPYTWVGFCPGWSTQKDSKSFKMRIYSLMTM